MEGSQTRRGYSRKHKALGRENPQHFHDFLISSEVPFSSPPMVLEHLSGQKKRLPNGHNHPLIS
jgi:hypothetical protein